MQDLTGRVVVVLGGSSGTGLATAREAAELGADVLVGSSSQARLQTGLAALPDGVRGRVVDITDEESVRALFQAEPRVDHLVVTASPGSSAPFGVGSVEDARGYMDGKFWGSYRVAHHARERLTDDGSITLVSGGLARRPRPGSLMVTCAFAATEALGRALAVELAPVRVNTLRLGTIDSDMWAGLPSDQRAAIMGDAAARIPAGRAGTPADVGVAAVTLMLNDYVTGSVIDVDGGIHISDPY